LVVRDHAQSVHEPDAPPPRPSADGYARCDGGSRPGSTPGQEDGLQSYDLLRGLEHLSGEQRSVVLLVSVEDLSYDEAASVLGMPTRMVI
jgi:DNA-directed RNA polymerase specialized sigma24 family protein